MKAVDDIDNPLAEAGLDTLAIRAGQHRSAEGEHSEAHTDPAQDVRIVGCRLLRKLKANANVAGGWSVVVEQTVMVVVDTQGSAQDTC